MAKKKPDRQITPLAKEIDDQLERLVPDTLVLMKEGMEIQAAARMAVERLFSSPDFIEKYAKITALRADVANRLEESRQAIHERWEQSRSHMYEKLGLDPSAPLHLGETDEEINAKEIIQLPLSTRTIAALTMDGIETIGQLRQAHREHGLLIVRNLGDQGRYEITMTLRQAGLELGDEE